VIEIGTLGGPSSSAYGINDRGDVTGEADRAQGHSHAFLFRDGKLQDIGSLSPAHGAAGICINNRDQIAGVTTDEGAFFWENGKMRRIRAVNRPDWELSYSVTGLNDAGTVIGTVDDATFWIGYLWDHGKATLPVRSAHIETLGYAINNRGDYVWQNIALKKDGQTLLRHHGQDHPIPPMDGISITVSQINDRGCMAGHTGMEDDATRPIYSDGSRTDLLPLLPGCDRGEASAINDAGEIVGSCYRASDNTHQARVCYWKAGDVYDLNSLIDPKAGWALDSVDGINRKGWIVGTGRHHGLGRGFILIPSGSPVPRKSR
jgi:probable HAF family extracellular repeat protein